MYHLNFPKISKLLYLLSMALVFSCTSAEKATEKNSEENGKDLQVLQQDKGITIQYKGKNRLAGGFPAFEKSGFITGEVSQEKSGLGATFHFTGQNKEQSASLSTTLFPEENVIIIRLSPESKNPLQGENYIGMFFDSIPDYAIGTALYKYKPVNAWTKPVQINKIQELEPVDNQFYFWKYNDSTYAAAIPLGGKGYSASLGQEKGKFGVKSVCLVDGNKENNIPIMAVAFGKDPYQMIQHLFERGMKEMGLEKNLRQNKTYPEILEYIGWCTWNAYGHDLSEKKLLSGVSTFKKKGFDLPFLLIDDGWLSITGPNGRLTSFKPDPTKFPQGFKPIVEKLKNEMGVKNVGVWHTLNGYWAGVDRNSPLGKEYADILHPYIDKVTWTELPKDTFYTPTPKSDAGFRFYDDWYTLLKNEGISFVKVDNQLVVDRIAKGSVPLWEAGDQVQENLQKAVNKHFNGTIINCMDMTVDAIYHYGNTSVARAVEDYFPEEMSYADMQHGNAAVHVLCANYNSLWYSPMLWPDFDMFQTHHPHGEFHAISRAISGGPIYLTDSPGKQNFDIIRALTYSDGRIIRADIPARPTEDCLFQVQDAQPFKAFSMAGKAGLLGVWNAADAEVVKGTFKPADVNGLQGEKFAVYEHFSKNLQVAQLNQEFPLQLKRMGYQLYYVVPIEKEVAVLGLVNKYNAPKTVLKQTLTDKELEVTLYEDGIFAAYLAKQPKQIAVDGVIQTPDKYTWENGLLKLNIQKDSKLKERNVRISLKG